jgi:hypothetical protein
MTPPTLKAFVLCDDVTDKPDSGGQKHLKGAGLYRITSTGSLPVKLSFWAFIQLSDRKSTGQAQLSLMRADSGRRYFFRPVTVQHADPVRATPFGIRLYNCIFPDRGVYFVELW